jgi:molecular chaperone GrpE
MKLPNYKPTPYSKEQGQAIIQDLTDTIKTLNDKTKELEEDKLRIAAEMDNFKKRIKKENQTYKTFILKSFVEFLLPFLDNLERGITCTGDYKTLKEGFNLSLAGYMKILKTFGIEPYDSVGKDFDPIFHDALSVQKQYDIKKNKIIKEITKGYLLNGKVIRPATVIVSL